MGKLYFKVIKGCVPFGADNTHEHHIPYLTFDKQQGGNDTKSAMSYERQMECGLNTIQI